MHSGSPAPVSNAPAQTAPSTSIQPTPAAGSSSTASSLPAAATSTSQPQAALATQNVAQEDAADETGEKKSGLSQKTQSAVVEKPAHEALVVKSSTSKLAASQAEAMPQAIPVIGIASNSGEAISGIMDAAPTVRTPVLRTVKVSQGVSQGLLVKKVSPDSPAQARQLRIEGTVQLEATIGKDGSVSNLKVLGGHPILARSAVEAVKQWKYKPYLLNGQAVEIDTQITVNFKLP